ncbi:hypothetical protein [uncultured Erythrobacter sp.]|uniref:hypothetical protein n=1 Tax=uncultured Erythrobacter sp. TaxID=263913 RepID=UPI002610FD91|nr:hypothetical protein [uncultured Erythrobacter sp.]
MSLETNQSSDGFEQVVLVGQSLLALGALLAFVFAPRADSPVALYPVTKAATQAIPNLLSQGGTQVLARGQLDGSYIIRGDRPGLIDALLHEGVLILNAAAPGCGPLPAGQTV